MLFFNSCRSTESIAYLQNLSDTSRVEVVATPPLEFVIQPSDVLGIAVSCVDSRAAMAFNPATVTFMQPGNVNLSASPTIPSYTVDKEGNINFPVLGAVKLAGLTRLESIHLLQEKISHYIKDPVVNLSILNFRISVLGEVNHPGYFPIDNERITIFEAIAKASDLTIYGQRENVMIIRENQDGSKEVIRVDLTDPDLLHQPERYYLRQNDVVYVESNKTKQRTSRYSQKDSFTVSLVSTIVSTVSVISSLLIALLLK